MAIEGIIGTVGSGKSVLLNKRMIDKAVDGRDLALNFEFNEQGLYLALRRRGMLHREAMDKINGTIVIRTYEQLRGLKNRWLGLDEGHFWFFSRMWERIQLADVQFWSLSRKLGVDVSIVTQRWGAVDATVRDLAVDVWHARPLVSREVRMQPFGLAQRIQNRLAGGEGRWLGMFLYTKVNDTMGNTKEGRKSLVGAIGHKSLCVLTPWEARTYDTGRFFTSPLIEEDARQKRVDYLRKVYNGELTPLQTCPVCGGLGSTSFTFRLEDVAAGVWQPSAEVARADISFDLVTRSQCPLCNGSGYFADPSADDVQQAHEYAAKGLLGPEIKARALGETAVTVKRGGGGRFARA